MATIIAVIRTIAAALGLLVLTEACLLTSIVLFYVLKEVFKKR